MRVSPEGEIAVHASSENDVRNEPENWLPPDFVTVLTTPPVKRPYSAETELTDVVVSWIASSMKRVFGVPRMLSMTTAPSTVKRLSNVWPPEIVAAFPSPVVRLRPDESSTAARIVRPTGSLFVISAVSVVEAWVVVETVSALAETVVAVEMPDHARIASWVAGWPAVSLIDFVTVWKP